MFDISWGELVLVGMVALIVIGPKELPTVIRTVGQWVSKIRRMASEFQGQFQEAMREAEFADLKQQVESIGDPIKDATDFNPLETARKEMEGAFEEHAADTPAPETSASDTPPSSVDEPPAPPAEAVTEPAAEPDPQTTEYEPAAPEAERPSTPPAGAGGGRAA